MSELRVDVVPIALEKHPNADSLSIVKVFGYTCIVKTSDFEGVPLAAYVPADYMASDAPEFSFLGDKKRIRAMRLRGIYSEGLLIKARPHWKIGDNVAGELGVTKYEPPEDMSTGGENESQPDWFHLYTDIESWRRYPDKLSEGEEVNIVEKIHGCINYNTRITMADFSKIQIGKIVNQKMIGSYVLGVDDNGKIVPTKITNVFNNGSTENWLRIRGLRRCSGPGNSFYSLICTPEHRIWSKGKYIQASQLKPGDKISLHRMDMGLTPIQEQVLLGKLLGDGSLHVSGCTAAVDFGHTTTKAEYVEWCCQAIGELDRGFRGKTISGYGSEMTRAGSIFSKPIKDTFSNLITSGEKHIPNWILQKLGPIAMAFWYMDDGSLGHEEGQEDRANFAICSFNEADADILVRALAKFDINAVYYTSPHSRLRLNADDAEKLFLLIAPYIPPCMQYKLPERYRGHQAWIPSTDNIYKSSIIEQTIISIEEYLPEDKYMHVRYDIETETHNYFAGSVLVHNCNARLAYVNNKLWVGSHRNAKRFDEKNVWWKCVAKNNLEEYVKKASGYILHAECYGQVQDLKYGAKQNDLFFGLFDISEIQGRRYLDVDEFYAKVREWGMEAFLLPILFRGPWSADLVSLAEGRTLIKNADNIREGFVVRPVKERRDLEIGRVVLKVVGEGYKLRKGGTEKH